MNTLLEAAQQGFDRTADENPYATTDRRHRAWAAGRWLGSTGRTRPRNCAIRPKGRLAINDMVLVATNDGFARES